ncbi:hypothetical protein SAY86_028249 [Trapa natans]|uniref:Uncharacterized protein n=1 Tax=Trapa natans TaxID=22666 RepID=A0AAN7MHC1_TRANT|nr:hypothetical protein SAY86_028249 [Trapa natans]
MGKNVGSSSSSTSSSSSSSWLTLVKRAFRSHSKDSSAERWEEHYQGDEEKKREKWRWLFRKLGSGFVEAKPKPETTSCIRVDPIIANEQRHAILVAAAQAAMEIARLTRPAPDTLAKENWASIIIQTSFRGYLVRTCMKLR